MLFKQPPLAFQDLRLPMPFVAYRREYHIRVDKHQNQMIYERQEELTLAEALPHFLEDFKRALLHLRPGFTVLFDLRRSLGPNLRLIPLFRTSQLLMVRAGIGMVAEVHPAGPSMQQLSYMLRTETGLPVRVFTDVAEAKAFLAIQGAARLYPAEC